MAASWAALVVAAGIAAAPPAGAPPLYTEGPHPSGPAATVPGGQLPELTQLAATAMPAVVGVLTSQAAPPGTADDSLRELFDKMHDGPRKGIGSGFVIHRDGWILTNAHVVEGADTVEVDPGEGEAKLPARVVGMDAESDVALLKVEAGRPLPVLPLGDSEKLSVAEWVMVIGSPFGLDHSVTLGIVSHTGRADISPVGRPGTYDFVQTDASINPGNSGGPVLNLHGEVVAIATAVNATGQGIGFAIPINMAKEIVGQLKDRGKVVRSWLGISVREPERAIGQRASGVEVVEVAEGSPAAQAGVRVGDVITTVQGHAITTPSRLRWYVSTAGVGREIELRLRRPGPHGEARPAVAQGAPIPPSPASSGVGSGGADEPGAGPPVRLPERTLKAVLVEVPAQEAARTAAQQALGE